MSVADSYARALYEAAKENKLPSESLDLLETQMDHLISVLDSSRDLRVALIGPIATQQEKKSFVEEIAKKMNFSPLLILFISLLVRKGRLVLLTEIREAFRSARLTLEGGIAGTLTTADPIADSDIVGLEKAFSDKLGKKVSFRVSTDPSLMAGVKVVVNGVTYDGTLRSQIQKLRDRLMTGTAGVYA